MDRRNFVKLGAASLALAGMAALAGCSNSKTEEAPKAEETKTEETKAEATRTIKVATAGTGEPYSLVDADGNWTGMCKDMWDEVSTRRPEWTIEMVCSGDHTSTFGDLAAGRVDVADNCYAITAKRLESYICCDPIYADAQVIAVQPDSEYKTFEDLRGCKVGVTSGQAAQNTVEEMAPTYDWEVVVYEESNAAFQDCSLGRIESIANTVTNIEKAMNAQGLEFRMLEEKLFGNNVSWFLMPENTELRDELNKVLAEMHEDGTIAKLTEKWFFEDMTAYISDQWLKADK